MAATETVEARANATVAMTARQRLIAVLLLGTNFMLSVDFSILNIALPEVGRAVDLDLANFPWVATAFALPAAGLLGHITAVVAATVIATSDVEDADAGLATGLVTTSQRVAVTVGIPLLGAVMLLRADLLAGIHLALTVDVLLTLTVVAMISAGFKSAGKNRTAGGA